MSHEASAVRIDKWLWAARFFKTRSLATEAIDAGHVRRATVGSVSGDRVKPALIVRIDDALTVQRGEMVQTITVTALSDRRGSATEASKLYRETDESIKLRLDQQAQRQASNQSMPVMRGRPTKQDRRKLAELFASNYADQRS
jgi:ribosome-associated heat shock protein Hsp15